jgi:Phosphotransferase enzyme family
MAAYRGTSGWRPTVPQHPGDVHHDGQPAWDKMVFCRRVPGKITSVDEDGPSLDADALGAWMDSADLPGRGLPIEQMYISGRDIPGLEEATAWLASHRPLDFVPGIMHGDYQFANVMYWHGAPACLAAIVDWEMGTIGDPKIDLAWALQGWPEDTTTGTSHIGYVDIAGMPGYSELLDYYARQSGRQVDDFDYYVVLARWKLAIVLEQGYQRAGDDPKLQGFGPLILELMSRAAELAESSDYRGSPG